MYVRSRNGAYWLGVEVAEHSPHLACLTLHATRLVKIHWFSWASAGELPRFFSPRSCRRNRDRRQSLGACRPVHPPGRIHHLGRDGGRLLHEPSAKRFLSIAQWWRVGSHIQPVLLHFFSDRSRRVELRPAKVSAR